MTQQERINNNLNIALFDGAKVFDTENGYDIVRWREGNDVVRARRDYELLYHVSWVWLMPVVRLCFER